MSLRLITMIRILLKVKVSETKSESCTLEGHLTDNTKISKISSRSLIRVRRIEPKLVTTHAQE